MSDIAEIVIEEDSELVQELWAVLQNHNVDEGLTEMIIDLIMRWEHEQPQGGDVIKLPRDK